MKAVDEIYVTDAYHSLSIEGYRVSAELIERVRSGGWNPDSDPDDRKQRDAMAARGYWEAFQAVKESVRAVLGGENPGKVADRDLAAWFRALFQPSVAAGLLKAANLAGHRNHPAYIRGSRHVPPRHDVMGDVERTLIMTDRAQAFVHEVLYQAVGLESRIQRARAVHQRVAPLQLRA